MRVHIAVGACALGLAAAGTALFDLTPGPRGAAAAGSCDVTDADISLNAEEREALNAVAALRASAGLPPLQVSLPLTRAAAWKANDLAAGATFAHEDSLGRTQHQRAADCGHAADAVGENIAGGFLDGAEVIRAWSASPAHYANLVAPQYRSVGIAMGAGGTWAMEFGLVEDAESVSEPVAPSPSTADAPPPPAARTTGTPLVAGANLVTYTGERELASRAFASLRGDLVGVYTWDAAGGGWLRYLPAAPSYASTLDWLEPGAAYVVVVKRPAAWTLP